MKSILETLQDSELIQDFSDEAGLKALKKGDKFYVGFDPTAASLQVGNLVPIMVSMKLAKLGLQPVILFGGATGAIGDPSGRSAERSQLLERDVITANVERQKKQITDIFASIEVQPEFVNNFDWTNSIDVLSFLRDVGKHFTVNYMIAKEVVKTRLNGDGISFTEFSYMLLQANDFYHLYTKHNVRMQIGGSDQWGNITAGLELIRRKVGENNALAFSIPLLTNSEGLKFGKSAGGAVWLDSTMTSPYQLHQFWLNTTDMDALRYLKIFTLLSDDVIAEQQQKMQSAPQERSAQKLLADSVTALIHGATQLELAKKSAAVLFGGSIEGMSDSDLKEIFKEVPSKKIERSALAAVSVVDALVTAGICASKGETKRLIAGGGVYINGERITEEAQSIAAFLTRSVIVVRTGKKNYFLIELN